MAKTNPKTKISRKDIQKKYRERVKESDNYEKFKEKNKIRVQKQRDDAQKFIKNSKASVSSELLTKKRNAEKDRKRVYRSNLKNSPISPGKSYKRAQTRGKAIQKVMRALPLSKDLASEVLDVVRKTIPKRKSNLADEILSHTLDPEHVQKIKDFYESDDISWVSPLTKQRSSKSTTAVRNMVLPLNEAYAEFKSRNEYIKIGRTLFIQLRPSHVKPFQGTPENMCVCSIHANFNYLILALFNFNKTLVNEVVCSDSTDDCFLNRCDSCQNGHNIKYLMAKFNEQDHEKIIKYHRWVTQKKNGFTIDEKVAIETTVADVFTKIMVDLPAYLKHILVNKEQSESFKKDIEKANELDSKICVIEVDFAENYKCPGQDQTQNANFCYNQVNLLFGKF